MDVLLYLPTKKLSFLMSLTSIRRYFPFKFVFFLESLKYKKFCKLSKLKKENLSSQRIKNTFKKRKRIQRRILKIMVSPAQKYLCCLHYIMNCFNAFFPLSRFTETYRTLSLNRSTISPLDNDVIYNVI